MNKEEIGAILKDLRNSSNLTQKEVAGILGRKQQIVGHWETGYSQPDANTLFALCEIYGTTVDKAFGFNKKEFHVSSNDMELLKKYRNLDDHGRESVDIILNRESQRVKTIKAILAEKDIRIADLEATQIIYTDISKSQNHLHLYAYLRKIACAGTGFFFDNIPTDIIEAPYVHGADFIIGVNGNSMEPDFHDGEQLYVQKVSELTLGDTGIFTISNECFVKELGEKGLISKNPDYEEIPGTEEVRLIGRVLGKIEED